MPDRISRDEVVHVADLARLALSDEEIETFTSQLVTVLAHAAEIGKLDTQGVRPTAHPLPVVNILRPDDVVAGLDRDEVLAQAPAVDDHRFRVPPVLGGEP